MRRSTRRLATLLLCLITLVARGAERLLPSPADVPPTRLRFGSISLYSENDKYFAGTDQHYTNGFKLSFLSTDLASFTEDPVPAQVQRLARALGQFLPPGRDYKLGLAVGQNIYTPANTATTAFVANDRPYAAWLYGSTSFQIYTPPPSGSNPHSGGRLDTIDVSLGLVGPGAFGRQVQNGVHDLLDIDHANGWHHQLHNEPGLILAYERKYRVATPRARDGLGADVIGHAGISLSNIFTYANAGAEVRAGWRLPEDFGTDLIRPSGDSNSKVRPAYSAFGFAAFEARAIVRDITLDGNSFRSSPSIGRRRFVGDLLGGVALGTRHWQFTYSQAVRTSEFDGQARRSVFGSFSITFYY